MTNFIGPDPIFGLPTYRTLWNDDTEKPAGGILICPIGDEWTPQLIFGGVGGRGPFEVAPKGNSVQPGPEYDGVWFYDCSDISLPEINIWAKDVSNGRLITTKKGRIGYTLVEIIELIKEILSVKPPCTPNMITTAVAAIKELKDKLSTIGVSISLPATRDSVSVHFCRPQLNDWRVLLRRLRRSFKEITEKQLDLIDLDVVLDPWKHTTRGSGPTPNCKYVFLGYWKRGKSAYPDPLSYYDSFGTPTAPDDPTLIPPGGTPPDKTVTLTQTYAGDNPYSKPGGASIGGITGTGDPDRPFTNIPKAYSFYNPKTKKMEKIKKLLDPSLTSRSRGIKPWLKFR